MPVQRNSDGLTAKQQKFCEEFLKDFNASAAYRRAKYKSKSPQVDAAKLLGNVGVQVYLTKKITMAEQVSNVSLAAVIRESGRLAFSDITEALDFTHDDGVIFKDSKTLPKRVTSCIRSVSSTRTIQRHRDGSETETVNMKMEFHGKAQALSFLGKFFGVGQDLNQARAALLKYGIAMVVDEDSPTGFRLEPHDVNAPAIASIEESEEATEFTEAVWETAGQP